MFGTPETGSVACACCFPQAEALGGGRSGPGSRELIQNADTRSVAGLPRTGAAGVFLPLPSPARRPASAFVPAVACCPPPASAPGVSSCACGAGTEGGARIAGGDPGGFHGGYLWGADGPGASAPLGRRGGGGEE